MSPSQLLIRWLLMAILTIISGLWQGKELGRSLLFVAALSASALTALAALYPLTNAPGLLGLGIGWLRHLLTFSLLTAIITQNPPGKSFIMGLLFASMLTVYHVFR